jgi:hypothetical protein
MYHSFAKVIDVIFNDPLILYLASMCFGALAVVCVVEGFIKVKKWRHYIVGDVQE